MLFSAVLYMTSELAHDRIGSIVCEQREAMTSERNGALWEFSVIRAGYDGEL